MAASDFGNEIEIFFRNLFFLQIFLFFIFASQREPLIAYKYSGSSSRSWHFNVSIATLRSMLRVALVVYNLPFQFIRIDYISLRPRIQSGGRKRALLR